MRNSKTRWWRKAASVLAVPLLAGGVLTAVAAGPAFAGAPYSCTTSSFSGGCPSTGSYSDPNIWESSTYGGTVRNQIWSPVTGETSTMSANSLTDWQDVINVPAGNTSVTGWPDSQVTYTQGDDTPMSFSNISSMTSTLDLTSQSVTGAAYDNGWDVWGGVTGNSSTDYQYEMMIWTNQKNRGTCGGATVLGTHAFGSQDFTLCWYGSDTGEFVWYLSDASGNPVNETSSSVDIYAMLQWMITNGYYPSDYGLNQITVGSEVCSTGGNNQDITLTGWTISATTGSGGQLQPSATTNAASSVTSTGAILNGTINPEGADTHYQFDYGTSTSYGSSTTSTDGGSGSSAENEAATISGLSPDTTYHYRVEATNSAGTTYGQDQTFTTQTSGGGTVLSKQGFEGGGVADYADWYGETLSNTTAQAYDGTHSLQIASNAGNWGIQENWPGTTVTPGQATSFSGELRNSAVSDSGIVVTVNWLKDNNTVLGTQTIDASDNASGWTEFGGTFTPPAGTTSAFFQIADSNGGTHYLDDVEVVQGGTGFGGQQDPAVTTDAASGVTSSAATLNGSVNPEGADTTYKFDYGTTASYGSSTTAADAGAGTTAVSESANLTGLTASTTYHYRIEATNSGGTRYGSDQTFTTSAAGGGSGAVTFDSVTGAKKANGSSLSWTHTVGSGTDRALLVEATVGVSDDTGCAVSVTDNGTALTKLDTVHTNGKTAGFLTIWGLADPPSGANAIAVSVSGCNGGTPEELTGGSESFAGVSQSTPFSAVTNATGASGNTSASITTPTSDLTTAFAANGSAIGTLAQGGKSRFVENQDNNSGAGNSAGGTAGTGTVSIGWNTTSDWWGEGILYLNHD